MNVSVIAVAYLLGPSVAVEVSSHDGVGDDALRGWLGARLLEEGYDLAPRARQAMVTVRVSDAGTGLAVDAVGNGVRSFAVERGPSSVQRLEVLHRALQAVQAVTVQAVTVAPSRSARRPGLVVRLSGRVDESLMAELTNAARDGGVHLHTEPGPGDALVCIAARGGLAEIGLGPARHGCAPADTVAATASTAERRTLAAELMARAIADPALLSAASTDALGGGSSDSGLSQIIADGERSSGGAVHPVATQAVTVQEDLELVPMQGPPRAEVRLAAEGGVVLRGTPDATMRTRLRIGGIEGFGGRIELGVVPSRVEGLRVVDTFLTVGPDWQVGLGQRARLMFAAMAGTNIHTFATDQTSAADVSWAVALPVGASLAVRGGARVHVIVHPGLSGVVTQHERSKVEDWQRTSWRVGFSVGFSHGWRIE